MSGGFNPSGTFFQTQDHNLDPPDFGPTLGGHFIPLIEKVADEAFRWICANAKSTFETPTEAVEEVLAEANV